MPGRFKASSPGLSASDWLKSRPASGVASPPARGRRQRRLKPPSTSTRPSGVATMPLKSPCGVVMGTAVQAAPPFARTETWAPTAAKKLPSAVTASRDWSVALGSAGAPGTGAKSLSPSTLTMPSGVSV